MAHGLQADPRRPFAAARARSMGSNAALSSDALRPGDRLPGSPGRSGSGCNIALAAADLPYLTRVTGALRDAAFASSLTAFELPALRSVGSLSLSSGVDVVLPALTQAGSIELVFGQTRIEMPALTQVSGGLHVGYAGNLARIDLRALTTVGGNLQFNDLSELTSLNITALNRVTGNFSATALNRVPYPSIMRMNDAETRLDRVGRSILIENIGCCRTTLPPENRFACTIGC